jgi:hypothetical protein
VAVVVHKQLVVLHGQVHKKMVVVDYSLEDQMDQIQKVKYLQVVVQVIMVVVEVEADLDLQNMVVAVEVVHTMDTHK